MDTEDDPDTLATQREVALRDFMQANKLALTVLKQRSTLSAVADVLERVKAALLAVISITYADYAILGDTAVSVQKILSCMEALCQDGAVRALIKQQYGAGPWSWLRAMLTGQEAREAALLEVRALILMGDAFVCVHGPFRNRVPTIPLVADELLSCANNMPIDLVHDPQLLAKACKQEPVKSFACHGVAISAVAYDKSRLFTGSFDSTIKVWQVERMQCLDTLRGHHGRVLALLIDRGKLFSASFDKTIKVWSLDKLRCLATLRGHNDRVFTLASHRSGLYSGSFDGSIRVWDLDGMVCVGELWSDGGAVLSLAFAEDRLFAGYDDCSIREWNIDTMQCEGTTMGHKDSVIALMVFNGQLISGSFDRKLKVWDLEKKPFKELGAMRGHKGRVFALVEEGGWLFSSSDDRRIMAWDVKRLQCMGIIVKNCDVDRAFTFGRGRLFLGCTTGSIKVLGDPVPAGSV
jgi:F-box/WD-40 domain protein 7